MRLAFVCYSVDEIKIPVFVIQTRLFVCWIIALIENHL